MSLVKVASFHRVSSLIKVSSITRISSLSLISKSKSPLPPKESKILMEEIEIKRSCAVKLMRCFPDHKMIRSFVGLGQEMYEYLKESKINFLPPVVNDLSVQSKDDLIIEKNFIAIIKCSNHTGLTWAFLDYVLNENTCVFRADFRYIGQDVFDIGFGMIGVEDDIPFGDTKNAATYCMYHCDGEISQNGSCFGNSPWKENDIVGVEFNSFANMVRFFVNGRLQPVSLVNSPPRLRFGIVESCTVTDPYNLSDPSVKCARYMHTMKVHRISESQDIIEFVAFRRYVVPPTLHLPPADVYDPDHFGYKGREVEWNYLNKKGR